MPNSHGGHLGNATSSFTTTDSLSDSERLFWGMIYLFIYLFIHLLFQTWPHQHLGHGTMVNLTNLEGFVVKNNIETIYVSSTSPKLICNPKGHSSLVLVKDVPQLNLKVDSYKYQIFQEKWSIHIPIGQLLRQILNKITRLFQKISLIWFLKFWLKFGKMLKNRPIHIQTLAFYKGSFIYQEADFATHVGGTSP